MAGHNDQAGSPSRTTTYPALVLFDKEQASRDRGGKEWGPPRPKKGAASLRAMCQRVLHKHHRSLWSLGDVRYDLVKEVVARVTDPEQLHSLSLSSTGLHPDLTSLWAPLLEGRHQRAWRDVEPTVTAKQALDPEFWWALYQELERKRELDHLEAVAGLTKHREAERDTPETTIIGPGHPSFSKLKNGPVRMGRPGGGGHWSQNRDTRPCVSANQRELRKIVAQSRPQNRHVFPTQPGRSLAGFITKQPPANRPRIMAPVRSATAPTTTTTTTTTAFSSAPLRRAGTAESASPSSLQSNSKPPDAMASPAKPQRSLLSNSYRPSGTGTVIQTRTSPQAALAPKPDPLPAARRPQQQSPRASTAPPKLAAEATEASSSTETDRPPVRRPVVKRKREVSAFIQPRKRIH